MRWRINGTTGQPQIKKKRLEQLAPFLPDCSSILIERRMDRIAVRSLVKSETRVLQRKTTLTASQRAANSVESAFVLQRLSLPAALVISISMQAIKSFLYSCEESTLKWTNGNQSHKFLELQTTNEATVVRCPRRSPKYIVQHNTCS